MFARLGTTVQLAARLCAHAEPDQILATEGVVEHSAVSGSLFSGTRLITPKGFDRAIPVYEVLWQGI